MLIRRFARPLSVAIALIFTSSSVSPVKAGFQPSALLGITVGVDKKTQDFINSLPADVKSQVLSLLQQALPMIDASVEKYLDQINDIMTNQILNLQCAMAGAVGNGIGQVKQDILGDKPIPVESLQKDQSDTVKSFSVNDPPGKYASAYTDLLTRTTTTYCIVQETPEAVLAIKQIEQDVRGRWNAWYQTTDVCPAAFACYDSLHDALTKLIAASDKRDIDAVEGSTRFGAITRPPEPGLLQKWDPTAIESTIDEMISIQTGIATALAAREAVAKAYIDDAGTKLGAGNTLVARAQNDLGHAASEGDCYTIEQEITGYDRTPLATDVTSATQQLTQQDPRITSLAASQAAMLNAMNTIYSQAKAKGLQLQRPPPEPRPAPGGRD